jgi:hypothetical protein
MDRRNILPMVALAVSVGLLPTTIDFLQKEARYSSPDARAGQSVSCALDSAEKVVCWSIQIQSVKGHVPQQNSVFCRLDDQNRPVCKLS